MPFEQQPDARSCTALSISRPIFVEAFQAFLKDVGEHTTRRRGVNEYVVGAFLCKYSLQLLGSGI